MKWNWLIMPVGAGLLWGSALVLPRASIVVERGVHPETPPPWRIQTDALQEALDQGDSAALTSVGEAARRGDPQAWRRLATVLFEGTDAAAVAAKKWISELSGLRPPKNPEDLAAHRAVWKPLLIPWFRDHFR